MIGPFQRAVLAELTGEGATVSGIAGQIGRPVGNVYQALAALTRKRHCEMLYRQAWTGAGVYRATAAGFRVLGVPWSPPELPPADDVPARPGECAECRYLYTAAGHEVTCGAAA